VFGLDFQTLAGIGIQLFNAAVLATALTYIMYKPVRNFLGKRTTRIAEQIKHAEGEMEKVEETKALYEEKLEDIKRERLEILEAARKLGVEKRTEMLNIAKTEADNIRERAKTEVQVEQDRVREVMKLYTIEASSAMAGKILTFTIDKDTQDKLFAETIAELEEVSWLN